MDKEKVIKKLRLTPAMKALVIGAPPEFLEILTGFRVETAADQPGAQAYDFVQVFAENQANLEARLAELRHAGTYDCLFWACYPKLSGQIKSDIKRDTAAAALSQANLRPVTQIAIDDTWSALRARPPEAVGT